jgi:hypothetical protein
MKIDNFDPATMRAMHDNWLSQQSNYSPQSSTPPPPSLSQSSPLQAGLSRFNQNQLTPTRAFSNSAAAINANHFDSNLLTTQPMLQSPPHLIDYLSSNPLMLQQGQQSMQQMQQIQQIQQIQQQMQQMDSSNMPKLNNDCKYLINFYF